MRDGFGSWGRDLTAESFAHALLGLGLVPGHLRGVARPLQVERAVAEELDGDPRLALSWRLDALPSETTSWASRVSARRLAEIVGAALVPPRQVSLGRAGALDPVAAWALFCPGGEPGPFWEWSFSIHASAPASPVRFGWPSRVGYFVGSGADAVARDLAGYDTWGGALYAVQPLTVRNPHCDVLLWRSGGGVGDLIERLSSAGLEVGHVATGLLVVFSDDLKATAHGLEPLLRLRSLVDATGLLLSAAPSSEPWPAAMVLRRLFEELAHNQPLAVAAGRATAHRGLLIVNERLPQRARIEEQAQALARSLHRSPGGRRTLSLDGEDLRRLELGPDAASPRNVARGLRELPTRLGWDHEGDTASTVGRVSRTLAERVVERPTPRYLQATFEHPHAPGVPLASPLAPHRQYLVAVLIGRRRQGYASGRTAFPTLPPPPEGHTHRLTVVLTEEVPDAIPQVSALDLPIAGDSQPCRFTLWSRDEGTLSARLTVLHRNRVLQTGVLAAPVGCSGEITFTPDGEPRVLLDGLDERLTSDATFVLAGQGAGASAHAFDGQGAAVLDLGDRDVESLNQAIALAIGRIAEEPAAFAGLRAPGSVELLRRLAQKGARLREVLQRHALRRGSLDRPRHLQIVAADPGKLLPLEFLYEGEPPEPEAEVCAGAEEALRTGSCPTGCPAGLGGAPAAADEVICPLAFWGLSTVIERHAPCRVADGDFLVLAEPVGGRQRVLSPFGGVVVGAATRANRHDPHAVSGMLQRIRQVVPRVVEASTWKAWVAAVAEHRPPLLALLVHVGRDELDTPELEIGDGPPRLSSDLVKRKHVRPAADGPAPVALLIGCETVRAARTYESCAARLQEEGAVLVVGSVAPLLGREAAPMTADLIEAMAAVAVPTPIGEVLRDLRRRLLLEGTPMVLALTALGDADWDIVGQEA